MPESKTDEADKPTGSRRRFRFSLRDLLGAITFLCLLGGLCLWDDWWFEERVLLLVWGISLIVGDRVARFFGRRAIHWPILVSVACTAVPFYMDREERTFWKVTELSWRQAAWEVWRPWMLMLVGTGLASLLVLATLRSLPLLRGLLKKAWQRQAQSPRLRWLSILLLASGAAAMALLWLAPWQQWPTHRRVTLARPGTVMFRDDSNSFATIQYSRNDTNVTLWTWETGRKERSWRARGENDERLTGGVAMLAGDRLVLASSENGPLQIYQLPEGKLLGTIPHDPGRTHPIHRFYAVDGDKQLLAADRSLHDGTILFSFWDFEKEEWTRHTLHKHGSGGGSVAGVSPSGRYAGVVESAEWSGDRALTIIDFKTAEVVLEKEYPVTVGGIVFFDDERMIGHGPYLFSLDGQRELTVPGLVVASLPDERLLLIDFRTILPDWVGDFTEQILIARHLGYLNRARVLIFDLHAQEIEAKTPWFYGHGMNILTAVSPDGKRLVWWDNQRRLLLWNVPD